MNSVIQEDCDRILKIVSLRKLENKRILITGVSGLLGRYLAFTIYRANQTLKTHARVTGVSLHGATSDLRRIQSSSIKFVKADVRKSLALPGRFDYIFHAAGYGQPAKFIADPFSTVDLNVQSTKNFLELARKDRSTFVFFSSAEVYGDIPRGTKSVSEDYRGNVSTASPRAIYAEAKRLGEALVQFYGRTHGVRGKVLRISHVYGPGISIRDTRVLGDFLRKGLLEGEITLMDQGSAVKTFGYIGDVTAMILHVALSGASMLYNVGGTDTVSIRELASRVADLCGVSLEMPKGRARFPHIGHDPAFVKLNVSKILREMRRFRFISLNEGLRRTIAWNKSEFSLV